MCEFTFRAITEPELDAWWHLRLDALHDHPSAFGADYETTRNAGPNYADRGYFANGPNALFAAFTGSGEIAGIAGSFREAGKRAHIAQIVSVYTQPRDRRQGVGAGLVQAVIDHLRQFPEITSIRISVTASNKFAVHTYEKLGFVVWGNEPDAIRLKDGTSYNEMHMVLRD